MSDSVIEIGKDGAFDISDPQPEDLRPAKPPSSKANKAKAAAQEESSMEDFAIKKKRGNEAYAANDFDLADKCYTSALEALSLLESEKSAAGLSVAALRVDRVALLSNRSVVHLRRAEDARSNGGSSTITGREDSKDASADASNESSSNTAAVHWQACLADAEAALALDPSHAKALYRTSRAWHGLGDFQKALAAARKAKKAATTATQQASSSSSSKGPASSSSSAATAALRDIAAWEAWLRAVEAEREAEAAATACGARALGRGDDYDPRSSSNGDDDESSGSGSSSSGSSSSVSGASAVAEQACLEAAAAYLHVLGTTASHTCAAVQATSTTPASSQGRNSNHSGRLHTTTASTEAQQEQHGLSDRHWKRGPRDATEGALYAAARSVALAIDTQQRPSTSSSVAPVAGSEARSDGQEVQDQDAQAKAAASSKEAEIAHIAKLCRDVGSGSGRVAGGGLATLLPASDPRRNATYRRPDAPLPAPDDDEATPGGAALRALRATMAALLTPKSMGNSGTALAERAASATWSGSEENTDASYSAGLVPLSSAAQAGAVSAFTAAAMKGAPAYAAVAIAEKALVRGGGLLPEAAKTIAAGLGVGGSDGHSTSAGSGDGGEGDGGELPEFIAASSFEGAKPGYTFGTSATHGVGYHLDASKKKKPLSAAERAEEERMELLLRNLPNDEAREGVKKVLKMTEAEIKRLPQEQQNQVVRLREHYDKHSAFSKQAAEAEAYRKKKKDEEGDEKVLVGPDGSPLLDPLGRPISKDHNPRDGQLPPPGVGGNEGGKKPQTMEEKLAQRRIDELKWLVEFAEKDKARAAAVAEYASASAAGELDPTVLDRKAWAAATAAREAEEAAAAAAEADARRAAATAEVERMRGASTFTATESKAKETTAEHDKRRRIKAKKTKEKERNNQFDEIRKLAQSASALSF